MVLTSRHEPDCWAGVWTQEDSKGPSTIDLAGSSHQPCGQAHPTARLLELQVWHPNGTGHAMACETALQCQRLPSTESNSIAIALTLPFQLTTLPEDGHACIIAACFLVESGNAGRPSDYALRMIPTATMEMRVRRGAGGVGWVWWAPHGPTSCASHRLGSSAPGLLAPLLAQKPPPPPAAATRHKTETAVHTYLWTTSRLPTP